jgi:hypothetical protein
MKTIFIKLTKAGPTSGPFNIYDQAENIIDSNVSKKDLVSGMAFIVNDNVIAVKIVSTGDCKFEKVVLVEGITIQQYMATQYVEMKTGCLWRHLTNIQLYNSFYGKTEPYILEYSSSFKFQDEILQSFTDYSKAYEYLPNPDGVFNQNTRIETDDKYFSNMIVYNGQQCSGMLNLFPKPLHNMQAYMSFPKFNSDSKDILFTKSDNFYKVNTFFDVLKDVRVQMFNTSCESLSIDKVLNQSNMDYGVRSFKKSQLRSKDLKIRMILNNSCTTHLVSNFIISSNQISYK